MTVDAGTRSRDARGSTFGTADTGGARNSAGVLCEVLSTVIERPWVLGGVGECVVGVDTTRFGGVAYVVSMIGMVLVGVARGLSTEGRGGGGISTPEGTRAFGGSRTEFCRDGKLGLSSPVSCGVMEARA